MGELIVENKNHYKMFRKGKLWCYALLSTFIIAGATLTTITVKADSDVEPNTIVAVNTSTTDQKNSSAVEKINNPEDIQVQDSTKQQNISNNSNTTNKDDLGDLNNNNKQQ